ncbi:hypothetical protein X907_2142 [Glycocaulis alkaliphilus]|uniref:Uncharacterized protein n=1 Tax=Glycocaulis alkaliphilus TaxID=1434191 RepID=A0A3T0EB48_9PROT|nr:2OG-Fe(II) oxygenase [Glycocaulis alkaliphilus]AZU04663.1 hypothetical protein X907_2142 [Glycocaulis alkaliphilus]GGB68719.1 hypothetical protein GCM10007417_05630 [Glycocaulis alkaliphilus]
MSATTLMNFEALASGPVQHQPYTYLMAENVVTPEQAAQIRADYPGINEPGYLPLSKLERKGAFAAVTDDLMSPRLAEILGQKLGIDLSGKPRMITVRRISKLSDGPIHNDSKSKILTMLLYLNEHWDESDAGCIRVLNGPDDFADYTAQVPPLAGQVFAFLRSDNSWHGHLPFEGERYVIQVTFLTSQDELDRKENRGGLQYFLKKLLRQRN